LNSSIGALIRDPDADFNKMPTLLWSPGAGVEETVRGIIERAANVKLPFLVISTEFAINLITNSLLSGESMGGPGPIPKEEIDRIKAEIRQMFNSTPLIFTYGNRKDIEPAILYGKTPAQSVSEMNKVIEGGAPVSMSRLFNQNPSFFGIEIA
jgi:hypothetical protein